ncbi:MAG: 2-phospho-L-lactate transferase [Myxococcales bacterium]|nr:2-phospho-L-lactate transferase [Myxococcales bacterium]
MTLGAIAYLSGGVGGARLLDGLAAELEPSQLTAIVNVGDDFDHLGLRICPDLDTVMYTLAGVADEARGWGLSTESFRALEMLGSYGADTWFQLGDRDLATHLMRSNALARGQRLTEVTAYLAKALGVGPRLLPASDAPLRTRIATRDAGVLDFQDWLVRRRAAPEVEAVRFEGSTRATEEVLAALEQADVVIVGPSNPYVSIDPILRLEGVRQRVQARPVVAVSPIVDGRAVKGPLARMIPALAGRPASAGAIASHYGGLLAGMVVEHGDERETSRQHPDLAVRGATTVMKSRGDRGALARAVLAFAAELSP